MFVKFYLFVKIFSVFSFNKDNLSYIDQSFKNQIGKSPIGIFKKIIRILFTMFKIKIYYIKLNIKLTYNTNNMLTKSNKRLKFYIKLYSVER